MNAVQDEAYYQWWQRHGEMAEPEIEYVAWKAGRNYEAAQQGLHPTSGTLRGLEELSTPEANPAPKTLSNPPTCG